MYTFLEKKLLKLKTTAMQSVLLRVCYYERMLRYHINVTFKHGTTSTISISSIR